MVHVSYKRMTIGKNNCLIRGTFACTADRADYKGKGIINIKENKKLFTYNSETGVCNSP